MSKTLEELRRRIDELDDRIHDALLERADLIAGIAEEKRRENLPYVQPAREAAMIRRLLARHRPPLPQAAVVRIWRELVGAVSLLQTGLKVSVSVESNSLGIWEMARDYFGSVVPMQKSSAPLVAVASVRDGESSFAVLPWPQEEEDNPWWTFLINQQEQNKMRIVCALPYGQEKGKNIPSQDKALVVSRIDFSPSGEDRSFIALDLKQPVSRTRIADVMKGAGLAALGQNTERCPSAKGRSLQLIEVDDYIAEDDPRLVKIAAALEGARCLVLGGYPVPPVYEGLKLKTPAPPVRAPRKKTGG